MWSDLTQMLIMHGAVPTGIAPFPTIFPCFPPFTHEYVPCQKVSTFFPHICRLRTFHFHFPRTEGEEQKFIMRIAVWHDLRQSGPQKTCVPNFQPRNHLIHMPLRLRWLGLGLAFGFWCGVGHGQRWSGIGGDGKWEVGGGAEIVARRHVTAISKSCDFVGTVVHKLLPTENWIFLKQNTPIYY